MERPETNSSGLWFQNAFALPWLKPFGLGSKILVWIVCCLGWLFTLLALFSAVWQCCFLALHQGAMLPITGKIVQVRCLHCDVAVGIEARVCVCVCACVCVLECAHFEVSVYLSLCVCLCVFVCACIFFISVSITMNPEFCSIDYEL